VAELVKATVKTRRVLIVDDRHKDWFAFRQGLLRCVADASGIACPAIRTGTDRSMLLAEARTNPEAASHPQGMAGQKMTAGETKTGPDHYGQGPAGHFPP